MSFKPVKPRKHGTTKAVVAALFDAVGGAKEAAFLLGRGPSQTYGYADESVTDAHIRFDDVRRLTVSTGATAAAEALALDAGGYFVPVAPCDESLSELMAKEETAHGKLMADLMRRVGRSDPLKIDETVAADLDALIAALVAARRKAGR